MRKSERVEGQESLHKADVPIDYLCSAIVISVQKRLVNFSLSNQF
jgi:hypothetical protein